VRVVDACGRDVQPRHLEFVTIVGEVHPAALSECRPQVLPGQRLTVHPTPRVDQIVQRTLRAWAEIVVAPEHEYAWHREQFAQALHDRGHRLGVCQVVAGVDDQVGLQVDEFA
jgi:hypothetical protein